MKNICLVILLILTAAIAGAGDLTIRVGGVDPGRGENIGISVYTLQSWEKKTSYRVMDFELGPGEDCFEFIIENLPSGEYMIMGLQDSNGNFKMDKNFLGMPKEGFFCTNNIKKPSWKKCAYSYDGEDVSLDLVMIYW